MRFASSIVYLVPAVVTLFGISAHGAGCEGLLSISPRQTKYGLVNEIQTSKGSDSDPLASDFFPDYENEIFIGLRDNHVYAIIGGKRFDGGMRHVRKSEWHKSGRLSPGVFVRLSHLPAEWLENIRKNTADPVLPTSVHCGLSVCRFIQQSTGHPVPVPGYKKMVPVMLIRQLMRSPEIAGIKIDTYSINTNSEKFLRLRGREEFQMIGASGGVLIGFLQIFHLLYMGPPLP